MAVAGRPAPGPAELPGALGTDWDALLERHARAVGDDAGRGVTGVYGRLRLSRAPLYCGGAPDGAREPMKKRIFCTIPQDLIKQPLLFSLVQRFSVVPNIRGASVTDTIAILSLELEGEEKNVAEAVKFLRDEGVQVEELAAGEERPVS